ncbi:MAG: response regulator [Lachnospiraceae bacterium]|nr:response regulator [Lachnospiraceae bacterium]
MYYVVLALQWVNIALVMAESWIVFFNLKSRAHRFLYLNTIATLIFVTGYLHALFSDTQDAYQQSMMMVWSGKVWIPISLLLFAVDLCRIKVNKAVVIIEGLLAVISYGIIIYNKQNGLFYTDPHFYIENGIPVFEYVKGPWYYIWDVLVAITIFTSMYLILRSHHSGQSPLNKKQYRAVIVALLIYIVLYYTDYLPIGRYYDLSQLGTSLCAVHILIAIFRYNLLDTESMAKEYIVDNLSAGVIATDPSGKVAYYNKAAEIAYPGLDSEPQAVLEDVRSAISEGKSVNIGERVYTFEERDPLTGTADGSKIYVLTDDTERNRYLADLEEQKRIADEANRAKSDFLASMSHEIRTPINTVLGMNEMILRESRERNVREYAGDIRSAGNTLLSIINDILDLSKIESGKMEIVRTEYDEAMMIYDLSNIISGRAKEKGLAFNVEVDPKIPAKLLGDDIRIKQVLMNILSNAVKYTHKGSVWMRVRLNSADEADGRKTASIHYEVEDTGIGIRPEDMDKLFSAFERLDVRKNRNIEGTGLGMTITVRLLAMMGSKLSVQSEYGKGSVFSFDLTEEVIDERPIGEFNRRVSVEALRECADGNLFTAPEARILVVDDNRTNRKVFGLLLKHTEIMIDEAENGPEAIKLATANHYDIIFMDHMMPDMDGLEAMDRIKAVGDGPCIDTPIIILTANAVAGSREMYLSKGCDGYLSKPISASELEEMIKEFLPEGKVII